MRIQRFSSLLLAIAVSASVSVGSLHAEPSVQWGDETTEVAVNRGLSWKKPISSSGVVTPDRVPDVDQPIRLVQYQGKTPSTPAQQDLVFPELRPQFPTPPTGATSESLVPTNPPSSFAAPIPEQQLKQPPQPQQTTKQAVPAPTLPQKLQTPTEKEVAPTSGTTPAPTPIDPITALPLPSQKGSKDIPCPDTAAFKSIREISYDIRPMPGELPKECPLVAPAYGGRYYGRTCFFWTASALCTKGAYFENVQLERYGHSLCPALEPIFSGVRFFVTIPLLPYKMGLNPPNECVYTLGHYRVGNCAPYMLDPLPISVRAILFEAAAVGGAIAIIP